METYVREFVDLLVEYEVVRFGEFTLKSGRRSPYFVNAGQVRSGDAIARLGRAFAARVRAAGIECDLVFGPSYKGVPLAVTTAMALAAGSRDVGFSFDRKEAKDHGEGGVFVGTQPADGMRVVIVDDVITSGQSIREAVDLVQAAAKVEIVAVVVGVDRQERGRTTKTTLEELRHDLGLQVLPVVDIRQIVQALAGTEAGSRIGLDQTRQAAIAAYLEAHG